ncbi:MAG TPA: right-handed parallel beta-helix repeat-containing protein [Acidimicrobiales bacterium]|nr:right-handed parallel beta-helix repeat-containing protein [Acidimicrobiales bacterium]
MTARRTLASAASLFFLCLGVVGVAAPAQAAHVSCGQTILVSTVLDANIGPCGAGLIIGADNVTLDLNGFTISGGPVGDGPGISMQNRTGVTVRNGTVTQFDAGVAITGGSGNTVTAMKIVDNRGSFTTDFGDGIALFNSHSNRITNNQVRNNGPYDGIGLVRSNFNLIDSNQVTDNIQSNQTTGIRLENVGFNPSNDNIVTNNLVANNGLDGVQVFAGGSRNQIRFNQIFGNVRDGVTVFAGGNNNVIEGNHVRGNREDGIHIRRQAGSFPAPTGNQILRNVSFGNALFDLRDDNPNCGGNHWHGNQGATFTPPCTMTP